MSLSLISLSRRYRVLQPIPFHDHAIFSITRVATRGQVVRWTGLSRLSPGHGVRHKHSNVIRRHDSRRTKPVAFVWCGMSRADSSASVPAAVGNVPVPARSRVSRRAFWLKQFYLWHWVSSAFALAAMIFFAITGITLNHAASFSSKPQVLKTQAKLPEALLARISVDQDGQVKEKAKRVLPVELRDWLRESVDADPGPRLMEWSEEEIYVDLPRPGGDGWMTIDRSTGAIRKEVTTRGLVAWLNDLHKGRNTGDAWILFMDFFSVVAIIFCLTGLALLVVHARRRPMTWPVVVGGILLPFIVIVFFLHL